MSEKMRYMRLSYTISSETTAIGWSETGDTPKVVKVTPYERLSDGARANSSLIELFNHCGSHIDMPGHMKLDGKNIADYDIDNFVFNRPLVAEVPLGDDECVEKFHLEAVSAKLAECDLLLIRSGYSQYRTDLKRYAVHTPGFSVEAAEYVVKNFPNVKAVGVDFLSFESISDTSHEFQAHKALLENGVFIIEDLCLDSLHSRQKLHRVFVVPLFVEEVDSFPVTVFAEIGGL
jgi:arylformamidase